MGAVNRHILQGAENAAVNTNCNRILKGKWQNLPLRKFFILTVLFTFSAVALLSGLVIWGCAAFRHYLLPDSDSVYLTLAKTYGNGLEATESYLLKFGSTPTALPEIIEETKNSTLTKENAPEIKYSIEKLENSYDRLTPKRQLAYTCCGILMVAGPVALSLTGVLVCCFYFYRRKLLLPLELLSQATKQIAAQNLDFTLEYECSDEMGDLCRSFSQMQNALCENNKKLWTALEERKKLQASVAHDLRNPIAIIQGYTEYLETKALSGKLNPEKTLRIAGNLNMAAKRLERYTESIHTLNQLEDMEVNTETVSASRLAADLAADFGLVAGQNGKTLYLSFGDSNISAFADKAAQKSDPISTDSLISVDSLISTGSFISTDSLISVDTAVLYRVLENIIGNSLRFSKKKIFLDFELKSALDSQVLCLTVQDDGKGFPAEMLQNQSENCSAEEKLPQYKLFSASGGHTHMGIGIAISSILCQKHGGTLSLSNLPSGGAQVKIFLKV